MWTPFTAAEARRLAWDDDDWAGGVAHCLTMLAPALAGARTVVDVGCGPGRLTVPVAKLPGVRQVTGVDTSPAMLAYAPAHPKVTYQVDWPPATLPLADAAFAVLVFQHLPDAEAWRLLVRMAEAAGVVRVQYAVGKAAGPTAWERPAGQVEKWADLFGLAVESEPDPVWPTWRWVTARWR